MTSSTTVGCRTRRSPLLLRLLLVAALPMAALGWFVDGEIGRLEASERAVEEIDRSTVQLVADLEALGAVRTERLFAVGALEARSMGVDPTLVAGLIGIDLGERLAEQLVIVETTLEFAGQSRLAVELEQARAASDIESMSLGYDSIEASLETSIASSSASVKAQAAHVEGGAVLITGSYTLDALLRHERALREQLAAFFSAVDPLSEPIRGIRADVELAVQTRALEESLAELEGIDEELARSVSAAAVSAETESLDAAVADRLAGRPRTEVDLSELGSQLDAGLKRIDAVGRLLHLAGDEQRSAAADLGRRAGDERTDRLWSTMVVAAWTVVATLAVSVSVSRPLGVLARDARAVGRGLLPAPRKRRRGPREVVQIRSAFDELTQNLGRVQARMVQLAAGDTGDDTDVLTGPLADAVDVTVERLRVAIREQEFLRGRLHHDATHDALTGLLNRAGLTEALQTIARRSAGHDDQVAVFYIDLDGFKPVNDVYGHGVGDAVLSEVARRLRRCVGDEAAVARVGGDEFVVVIVVPHTSTVRLTSLARALGQQLVDDLGEPIVSEGQLVRVGASVGIAIGAAAGEHGDLQAEADHALYRAKSRGKGRVECFDPGLRDHLHRGHHLEREWRRACADEVVAGDVSVAQPAAHGRGSSRST